MNFELSDDQQAIKRTAHDFLAARYKAEEIRRLAGDERGFTDEQWSQIADLGWPGLVVPEELGGLGLGAVELVVLQEELGYALAPTPFFSNVCATLLLAGAGTDEQRAEHLPSIVAGERRAALALWDRDGGWEPGHSALDLHGGALTGHKVVVADAASADLLVVAGIDGRHFLVDVHDPGVTITATPGIDTTRKLYDVEFDAVEAHALVDDAAAVQRAYDWMATALAAESVGIGQRTMEMAIEYAKDRKQFDRPIGSYQAVSHRCAQMLLEVEGARSVTYYAAWALDHEPESGALAASMAKSYAGDAGWRVAASSLQVHGGIGFTWEHDLHFFLKRATANAHAFGDGRWHRERVAELSGV